MENLLNKKSSAEDYQAFRTLILDGVAIEDINEEIREAWKGYPWEKTRYYSVYTFKKLEVALANGAIVPVVGFDRLVRSWSSKSEDKFELTFRKNGRTDSIYLEELGFKKA